jgi:hypothetical protein
MIRHKWSGLIAIGVAAIVLLGAALGVALAVASNGDAAAARPSDDIAQSVCQFEGSPVSELRLMPSPSITNLVLVESKDTEYWLNPESKKVALAFYGGNMARNDVVSLTQEDARIVATQFAEKHCDNLPVFTLQRSELKGFDQAPNSTATVMRAYEFEWVQVLDGALTPNSVLIQVNPGTGNVMTYAYRYQPIESAGAPSLSQEDAKTIVADRVLETAGVASTAEGKPSPDVSFLQEPELRIVVKDGKQVLVWRIVAEAQGDFAWSIGGQYDINAQNGSIVEEDLFL